MGPDVQLPLRSGLRPPPFLGGQGRTTQQVRDSADALVYWLLLAAVAVLLSVGASW